MSDLWLMIVLVVALLIGNLWLLKRNSKQQMTRKTTVARSQTTRQNAQAAAAQTAPIVATSGKAQTDATDVKAADTDTANSD